MIGHADDDGFEAILLRSPDSRWTATFLPGLNMLGSSLLHDDRELLHRRGGPADYAARGKTCGIPLLHPWANRLAGDSYDAAGRAVTLTGKVARDAGGLPIHGLLGGPTRWEIAESRDDGAGARLVARFDFAAAGLLANFPFPHEIRVAVALTDAGLEVTTTITPTSDAAVPVSFGWHPYLQLPGTPRQGWKVSLPVRRRAVLDAAMIPTGELRDVQIEVGPLGERTFDDLCTAIATPRVFAIDDGRQRIEMEFDDGYPFAQLWAPPASPFLCIEPMTAATNALRDPRLGLSCAPPGGSFTARFAIRVRPVASAAASGSI